MTQRTPGLDCRLSSLPLLSPRLPFQGQCPRSPVPMPVLSMRAAHRSLASFWSHGPLKDLSDILQRWLERRPSDPPNGTALPKHGSNCRQAVKRERCEAGDCVDRRFVSDEIPTRRSRVARLRLGVPNRFSRGSFLGGQTCSVSELPPDPSFPSTSGRMSRSILVNG